MKLIGKKEISPEICYDISVKNNNNFFANGLCVHNSNAGIQFENGIAYPQKRTDFITVQNDNCGFAKFVSELGFFMPQNNMIVYGEWAGPGVQKTDAVTKIAQKTFFVFSILDLDNNVMVVEPTEIEEMLVPVFGENMQEKNVYILPWHTPELELDFSKQSQCQSFIDSVMKEVDEVIANEDPYIKQTFGVEGPGEGLVMYGIAGQQFDGTALPQDILLDYIFKAKTESHSVQVSKKRNHVAPERPEGVDDFISMFFTEARFEQMLSEIGGEATREKTGAFMKAVMSDVHKESTQEILLADFEWKDVPKYAAPIVKTWWFKKCDVLG